MLNWFADTEVNLARWRALASGAVGALTPGWLERHIRIATLVGILCMAIALLAPCPFDAIVGLALLSIRAILQLADGLHFNRLAR